MADGTERKRECECSGLPSAEDWDKFAEAMQRVVDCMKRCAETLRKEGRDSASYDDAVDQLRRYVIAQHAIADEMDAAGAAYLAKLNS